MSDVWFITKIQHIIQAGHFDYLFPDRELRTPTAYSIISNKLLHIIKRIANEPDEEKKQIIARAIDDFSKKYGLQMIGDWVKEFALRIPYDSYIDINTTMKYLTSDITIYCVENKIDIDIK